MQYLVHQEPMAAVAVYLAALVMWYNLLATPLMTLPIQSRLYLTQLVKLLNRLVIRLFTIQLELLHQQQQLQLVRQNYYHLYPQLIPWPTVAIYCRRQKPLDCHTHRPLLRLILVVLFQHQPQTVLRLLPQQMLQICQHKALAQHKFHKRCSNLMN